MVMCLKGLRLTGREDDKRISDWLATGGKEDDPYIQRQIKYLKQVEKAATKERK